MLRGQWLFFDAGVYDLGVDTIITLARAYRGEGEFKNPLTNLRLLFRERVTGMVVLAVRADSGIMKISQLKGKRVASDFGGNIDIHNRVTIALLTAGLTWKDVTPVPVPNMTASRDALREGRTDACFVGSGATPDIQELNAAMPLRFLPLERDPSEIPEFRKSQMGSEGIVVPPSGAIKEPLLGVTVPFWYFSSPRLSEEAVYQIVKAIWDNYKEIQSVHPDVKDYSREIMFGKPVVPYHNGAVRLYKEKGVWTDEFEKLQKALLGQ